MLKFEDLEAPKIYQKTNIRVFAISKEGSSVLQDIETSSSQLKQIRKQKIPSKNVA